MENKVTDRPVSENAQPAASRTRKLLQSGIVFSAVSFLTGLGNLAFQAIIGNRLKESGEYSLANNTLNGFMGLLGLPLAIATTAITHYIARFHFSGDDARLQGLLAGCRKFLFHLTLAGSALAVTAIFLAHPLSHLFNFPRISLTFMALGCVLAGLWGGLATALCQGLSWFKRLALIGFTGVCLRLAFGWFIMLKFPTAEMVILASGIMALANLVLLYWRKDLVRPTPAISPWNREFVGFLILSAACIGGNYCFIQSDQLVAQKYFPAAARDAYSAAGLFARALPITVGPLLTVLFTHRSTAHTGDALREQLKLIGLYAAGLVCGLIGLLVLKVICLKAIGRYTPESAAMMGHLATTMVFVGLLQALSLWALASRWVKIALLYGCLGLAYWLTLFALGKTPTALLTLMPLAAGIAFALLLTVWLLAMRRHSSKEQA